MRCIEYSLLLFLLLLLSLLVTDEIKVLKVEVTKGSRREKRLENRLKRTEVWISEICFEEEEQLAICVLWVNNIMYELEPVCK